MEQRQKIISAVKEAVLKVAPGAEIILFGSRSRGDYREESDWDFLILTDRPATEQLKKKIRSNIFEVELKKNQAISSIIHTKNDWDNLAVTPLYKSIQKEGISV